MNLHIKNHHCLPENTLLIINLKPEKNPSSKNAALNICLVAYFIGLKFYSLFHSLFFFFL